MGIFDKMFGGPKVEDKKGDELERSLPPFEDGSDSADGDQLPEALTMEHDFAGYLKKHPELRPESPKKE